MQFFNLKPAFPLYLSCVFIKTNRNANCYMWHYHKASSISLYKSVVSVCSFRKYHSFCYKLTKDKILPSLKLGSHFPKNLFYLLEWKPFKVHEKCFLLHLKSSFRSQDILVFALTFCSCRKNGLIKKIRIISKFMTSQPG